MAISAKEHATLVLVGDHRPRVVNHGSFERPRYVAWTPTREGPARPDVPAAMADLRDMLLAAANEKKPLCSDEEYALHNRMFTSV